MKKSPCPHCSVEYPVNTLPRHTAYCEHTPLPRALAKLFIRDALSVDGFLLQYASHASSHSVRKRLIAGLQELGMGKSLAAIVERNKHATRVKNGHGSKRCVACGILIDSLPPDARDSTPEHCGWCVAEGKTHLIDPFVVRGVPAQVQKGAGDCIAVLEIR